MTVMQAQVALGAYSYWSCGELCTQKRTKNRMTWLHMSWLVWHYRHACRQTFVNEAYQITGPQQVLVPCPPSAILPS